MYRVYFINSMYFIPHFGHTKVCETSIWTPCFQILAKTMVTTLEGTVQDRPSPRIQLGLNIALHNLPETNNEIIDNKENNVLKEGIKLQNITVYESTERKNHIKGMPQAFWLPN